MQKLLRNLDDLLLLSGCVCVLVGVTEFSPALAWIIGGLMMMGFAYLVAKKNASNQSGL
jgi:hypothetical protein